MTVIAHSNDVKPGITHSPLPSAIGALQSGLVGLAKLSWSLLKRAFRPARGLETQSERALRDMGLTPRDVRKPPADMRPAGLDYRL